MNTIPNNSLDLFGESIDQCLNLEDMPHANKKLAFGYANNVRISLQEIHEIIEKIDSIRSTSSNQGLPSEVFAVVKQVAQSLANIIGSVPEISLSGDQDEISLRFGNSEWQFYAFFDEEPFITSVKIMGDIEYFNWIDVDSRRDDYYLNSLISNSDTGA